MLNQFNALVDVLYEHLDWRSADKLPARADSLLHIMAFDTVINPFTLELEKFFRSDLLQMEIDLLLVAKSVVTVVDDCEKWKRTWPPLLQRLFAKAIPTDESIMPKWPYPSSYAVWKDRLHRTNSWFDKEFSRALFWPGVGQLGSVDFVPSVSLLETLTKELLEYDMMQLEARSITADNPCNESKNIDQALKVKIKSPGKFRTSVNYGRFKARELDFTANYLVLRRNAVVSTAVSLEVNLLLVVCDESNLKGLNAGFVNLYWFERNVEGGPKIGKIQFLPEDDASFYRLIEAFRQNHNAKHVWGLGDDGRGVPWEKGTRGHPLSSSKEHLKVRQLANPLGYIPRAYVKMG